MGSLWILGVGFEVAATLSGTIGKQLIKYAELETKVGRIRRALGQLDPERAGLGIGELAAKVEADEELQTVFEAELANPTPLARQFATTVERELALENSSIDKLKGEDVGMIVSARPEVGVGRKAVRAFPSSCFPRGF